MSFASGAPTCRWRPSRNTCNNVYRLRPDFVYSVSRDFARTCQTPMLVLADDVAAHPLQTSIDIVSHCPNDEITVFPWTAQN